MTGTTATRRALLRGGLTGMVLGLSGAARAAQTATASEVTLPPLLADLEAAERILGLDYTAAERAQLARGHAAMLEGLQQIRKLELANDTGRALRFDPRVPGRTYEMPAAGIRGHAPDAGPLPASASAIALAPVWKQAAWLRRKALSSVELTKLYLQRIERLAPKLENFITVTGELALAQARRADDELARGRIRSALHGIPYGLKDIFDVEGVSSTWGAEPYAQQIAQSNAAIVERLEAAGAVLLGKTAVGALAYGDIWHAGKSRNPWNPDEGSSGSSAGSASATAAGLAGFAIGTETLGSIVSPSHRCGTTGLRPTFGRVSRRGGMALCWSWDKVGPIARCAADCALVLDALNGGDAGDWDSIDAAFGWSWQDGIEELRVGYVPEWFESERASDIDRKALEAVRASGARVQEITLAKLPYEQLATLVLIEAAASFSALTLGNRDDELTWQDDMAWPNTWRRARLFPAVEMVQLERLRREAMLAFDRLFDEVDVLIGPNFAGGVLPATNATGHPCLALKAGFQQHPARAITGAPLDPQGAKHRVPNTVSLWSGLFREDRLVTLGRALEPLLGVADEHPPIAQ